MARGRINQAGTGRRPCQTHESHHQLGGTQVKISPNSLKWAVESLALHGDTDLFPQPVELRALGADVDAAVARLSAVELPDFAVGASRRFIVPKGELSYRQATQLDPLDSVLLTALVYEFGQQVEDLRRSQEENTVFSYRFSPSADGELFASHKGWNDFWQHCRDVSAEHPYILVADIADFYNQVYHHTYENQLVAAEWPNQAIQLFKRVIQSTTAKVSRGVPVGPHWAHLIAEASLIPVDNSLAARGIKFARFVDDIVVFAESEEDAHLSLYVLADVLDKQQRLHLQNAKTQILRAKDFREHCDEMIDDRPINDLEKMMVEVIKKHSGGDPYHTVLLSELDDEELAAFSTDAVETVLSDYLNNYPPDFVRLRWFLRRIAQVGHPAGVRFCLEHFDELLPAMSEVCRYLLAVSESGQDLDWLDVGDLLLAALGKPLVRASEYFQLSLLSLFGKVVALNHVDRLIARYPEASPSARREIITAAAAAGVHDWLRELKEQYAGMDPWTQRAFVVASSGLPAEERQFFLKSVERSRTLEELMVAYAKTGA